MSGCDGRSREALLVEADAVVEAEQVERVVDAEGVEHLVGGVVLDPDQEVAGAARKLGQACPGRLRHVLEIGDLGGGGALPVGDVRHTRFARDDDRFLQSEYTFAGFCARAQEGAQKIVVEQMVEALDGLGAAAHALGPRFEGDVLVEALMAQVDEAGVVSRPSQSSRAKARAWLGSRSSSKVL